MSWNSDSYIFRSLDDVEAVLEFAKLDREEIKPLTQSIYFSDQLENDVVRLVELDSTVLKALESGEKYDNFHSHRLFIILKYTYDVTPL